MYVLGQVLRYGRGKFISFTGMGNSFCRTAAGTIHTYWRPLFFQLSFFCRGEGTEGYLQPSLPPSPPPLLSGLSGLHALVPSAAVAAVADAPRPDRLHDVCLRPAPMGGRRGRMSESVIAAHRYLLPLFCLWLRHHGAIPPPSRTKAYLHTCLHSYPTSERQRQAHDGQGHASYPHVLSG